MPITEIQELKKRYPKYKDVPDELMLQKLGQKFPEHEGLQRAVEREFGVIKEAPKPAKEKVKEAFLKVAEPVHRVGAGVVGFMTGSQPPRDIQEQVAWMKEPMESEYAPGQTEERQVVALKRAMGLYLLGKIGVSEVKALFKDPRLRDKLSTAVPQFKYRVKKAVGIPQETALKVMTDPEIRAAYKRGDLTLGKAVQQSKSLYREEFVKRLLPKTQVEAPKVAAPRILDTTVKVPKVPAVGNTFRGEPIESVVYEPGSPNEIWVNKQGYPISYLTKIERDALGMEALTSVPKEKPAISKIEITKEPPAGVEIRDNLGRITEQTYHLEYISVPKGLQRQGLATKELQQRLTKAQEQGAKFFTVRGLTESGEKLVKGLEKTGIITKEGARPGVYSITPPMKPQEVKVPKVTKYSDDSHYQVDYRTPAGIRKTTMSGTHLNELEGLIQINQIPSDSSGTPILEIVDTVPVKGTAGFANLTILDDAVTNMQGFAEEKALGYSQFAKKWGTPFFMGEKYPAFKPVYTAVRESVDYGQELNYTGIHLLNPKFLRALPENSKTRIVDALRLGNIEKREIGEAELKKNFGFSDDEVKGFKSIRRMYKYSTEVAIKRRKLAGGYDDLPPEDKAKADAHIAKQVRKFEGYVAQTRLGGNWATYVESKDPNSPNFPFSFSLHPNKAEAIKESHLLGGTSKNVYLRKNLKPTIYGRMSITDLENLADSAGVEADSPDIKALVKEVQGRSFNAHWIRRKDRPGYKWTMDNVIESAMDYNQGASSGLARAQGRGNANRAHVANLDKMTPELKKYSSDYMNDYFEMGAIGMPTFQHLLYNWEIALKVSQMGQNLSQPLATTLSSMMEHYPLVEAHKVFLNSYDLAGRYTMYKADGKRRGLSSELLHYLNKLDRQGALGEQMVKFMQDSRTFSKAGFDKITGSSMRVVEFWNRVHAAIIGRRAATDKAGLTTKDAILTFGKDFISRTQFSYGRHNLPRVITGAGNLRNLLRLMYTFRHYQVSNLQRIMQMSPLRGGKGRQWTSALGAALALHGWKGLPFMGLAALAWKKATGRTMDYDLRKAMADTNIPGKAIDLATVGLPALAGADISQLVGMGDVVPTYGDLAENVVGAPAGFTRRMGTALYFALRGDMDRAIENASPGTIRNALKGLRYAREKVRTAKGELIAAPSARDIVLQSMGFMPLSVSKKWKERETKKAMEVHQAKTASDYYQRIAEALDNRDYEGMRRLRLEAREKGIRLGRRGTRDWRKRRRGRDVGVPRTLRREFKQVEKAFK